MLTVEVEVSSLGGLGDGIASYEGRPLFIEKSAPGDRLSVRITHETKEALRGEIVEIIASGKDRSAPPCPYFSACGGCALQHLSEGAYRQFKSRVVQDALAHGGFADAPLHMHFLPAASRRRVELKWDAANACFALYASRSRRLVPIANCLILEPSLQALLPTLAETLSHCGVASLLKTVSLTAADSGIDVELEALSPVQAKALPSEITGVSRLCVNGQILWETAPVTMQLGGYAIALPPGAFLQASREGQKLLTAAVLEHSKGAKQVADLFCGIGSYSFPLAASAGVLGVELDANMAAGLAAEAKRHRVANLKAQKRDLFKTPLTAAELTRFDAIVLNPPRAGAKAQCEQLAQSKVKRVAMVSCSPASFARDAKILKNGGFTLESALGVDQFVMSAHVEIVASFLR